MVYHNPCQACSSVATRHRITLPVNVRAMSEVSKALDFFMGKNTPERKEFIVNNLISDIS